ncbi:MAG: 2,3-bisphosphoglycerate-independent phosphoglycerate mutase, partial [Elusimicrobiaceae bacterium]
LGKMVPAALEKGYYVLVTSDHGNAEEMWDDKIGMPKTPHTCNLVTMTLCGAGAESLTLRARGILADIAPTALALLGVDIPREMSAQSLIEEKVSA